MGIKDKVPYIIETVLKTQETQGFELSHAVMMVSLLEHLILDEGLVLLESSYQANNLSSEASLAEQDLDRVFKSYMEFFAAGSRRGANVTESARIPGGDVALNLTAGLNQDIPAETSLGWDVREGVLLDVHRNSVFARRHERSPFVQTRFSFEDVTGFMTAVNHQFNQIHRMECQDLKEGLVDMELADSGRVPLKHFWAKGHIGSWDLRESLGYLRQLGALDETSPVPKVIIPNYVGAVSNCDAYSEYFSLCCVQECEDLLGQLSSQVRAHSAKPAVILDLVANLSS